MSKKVALTYTGGGYMLGVPARDLTEDEVKAAGGEKKLLATGFYAAVKQAAVKQPKEDGE